MYFGEKNNEMGTNEGNIGLLSKLVLNGVDNTYLEESGTEALPSSTHTLKFPLTTTTRPVSLVVLKRITPTPPAAFQNPTPILISSQQFLCHLATVFSSFNRPTLAT